MQPPHTIMNKNASINFVSSLLLLQEVSIAAFYDDLCTACKPFRDAVCSPLSRAVCNPHRSLRGGAHSLLRSAVCNPFSVSHKDKRLLTHLGERC